MAVTEYTLTVAWSDEDQAWIVRCEQFPGLLCDDEFSPGDALRKAGFLLNDFIELAEDVPD